MSSYQKVVICGNVGNDLELRHTESTKTPVCNIRVATNETYKRDNGREKVTRTEWHQCVLWGRQAEVACQFLKQGSKILIEGRLRTREFERDEWPSARFFTAEIHATRMVMLDRAPTPATADSETPPAKVDAPPLGDDDVPFDADREPVSDSPVA